MKLLCLVDLHQRSEAVVDTTDRTRQSSFVADIAVHVCEVSPGAVVIGDTDCPDGCICFRLCCEVRSLVICQWWSRWAITVLGSDV